MLIMKIVQKMKNALICTLLILCSTFGNGLVGVGAETSTENKNGTLSHHGDGIHIFKFDFGRHVATPFVVCCWVLLASIAKIGMYSFIFSLYHVWLVQWLTFSDNYFNILIK